MCIDIQVKLCADIDNFKKTESIKSVLMNSFKDNISNPFITIAIPTYKRHVLLKEAIDSALNQIGDICEFEVLVVDNEGETIDETETEKLIKTYSDSRLVYYRNEQNIGMAGNWNRCISLARGRWIAFLHDDDLLKSEYIIKISRLLAKKQNIGAIVASFEVIDVNQHQQNQESSVFKMQLKDFMKKHSKDKLMRIRPIDNQICNFNIYNAPTCGAIFNKKYLIKEGGFNEEFFPVLDWFFVFKFNRSYKIYKPCESLGYYRILDNESLKTNTLRKFIIATTSFREFNHKNSLIGWIMYKVFKYEPHVLSVDGFVKQDKSQSIKPIEFNEICEYRIRPKMLFLYRKMMRIYWVIKKLNSVIWG